MHRVFEIFEQILSIPRSSGKEDKISDYIIEFATTHNFYCKKDSYNNVFIKKDNYSDKTIILQAHSDMVCVSSEDYDFDKNGIKFYINGDYYMAHNTSLGADDGIGIAIILAILEEDNMPNIEVMITTQEETTMLGATNFDYTLLSAKTLISLDGIKEADIESSSAGMLSITLNKKITFRNNDFNSYKLNILGLAGGHSGDDIDKNRCNAIKLCFKIIDYLNIKHISDFEFGKKDNVIPCEGNIIFSSEVDINELQQQVNNFNYSLCDEDRNLKLSLEKVNSKKIINESYEINSFISLLENGLLVQFEDKFPLLSSNIGVLHLNDDELVIKLSIRSSDKELENAQLEKLKSLCNKYNFNYFIDAKKPFFPYSEKSNIREILAKTYKELYNKETITKKVHACMEGGIISNNIDELDMVTIAPTINDCHTLKEKVSISSTIRVYDWLKETLKKFMEVN